MTNVFLRGTDIVEVSIKDSTGRKLWQYRANADDSKSVKNIFQSVVDKYGLRIRIELEEDKSLAWIDKDITFKF